MRMKRENLFSKKMDKVRCIYLASLQKVTHLYIIPEIMTAMDSWIRDIWILDNHQD